MIKDKEKYLQYQKEYKQKNADKIKAYRDRPDIKLRIKNWKETHAESWKQYNSQYQKDRRNKDPILKLIGNRRNRRYQILKNKTANTTKEDLGCSIQAWKQYLESKFDENTNWENYGTYWELDEIIPISAWDMSDSFCQKACFHYLNSQPLEKSLNKKKSAKNYSFDKEKQQFLMVLKALDIL